MTPLFIDLPEHIETPHLTLQIPKAGFGQKLHEAIMDGYSDYVTWLAWLETPPTAHDVEGDCRKHHADFILRSFIRYLILEKSTGEIVGRCAYPSFQVQWDIPQFGISYFIRKSARGKGFATEASLALSHLSFDLLKAKMGVEYPLTPHTLILKGSYKNDLKTRLFFKELIGNYFHFTAFGIDWLEARWLEGKPPTYQDFAEMWKTEYAKRKKLGTTPKEEWAYINFTQKFMNTHPDADRATLLKAWEAERIKHKESALKLLAEKNDHRIKPHHLSRHRS